MNHESKRLQGKAHPKNNRNWYKTQNLIATDETLNIEVSTLLFLNFKLTYQVPKNALVIKLNKLITYIKPKLHVNGCQ